MEHEARQNLNIYLRGIYEQINDGNYVTLVNHSTYSGKKEDFLELVISVLIYRIMELEEKVEELEERPEPDPRSAFISG